MKIKKMCCVALAVSMLATGSAMLTANANELESHMLGDVNFDGKINVEDIAALNDYLNEQYKPDCTDSVFAQVADLNGDGKVDFSDLNVFIDEYIKRKQEVGDVNLNGVVDVNDATYVQQYLADDIADFNISNFLSADFNNDGQISVNDVTYIQNYLSGGKAEAITQEVKDDDAKYRKEYSKYLTSDVLAAMQGCYLIKNDETAMEIESGIYFRDSTWLYRYVGVGGRYDSGLRVIGTYDLENKDIVFPAKTDGGVTVDGIGCGSSQSEGVFLSSNVYAKGALAFSFADNDKSNYYDIALNSSFIYGGDCYGLPLNSVFIPSGYDVERDSFKINLALKYVFLSDNVTLNERCFYSDTNLRQIKFPDTITKISDSVVSGCENLTYVKIPNSVKEIDEAAFTGTGLSRIILGKNVEVIRRRSFSDTSPKEVYVYNPTMTIEPGAFYNYSMVGNGYINPDCTFYGYNPSTLLEWLQEKKAAFDKFEGTMIYKFALIK